MGHLFFFSCGLWGSKYYRLFLLLLAIIVCYKSAKNTTGGEKLQSLLPFCECCELKYQVAQQGHHYVLIFKQKFYAH